jgi:transcriptional regulator with XRE-family HTH domain
VALPSGVVIRKVGRMGEDADKGGTDLGRRIAEERDKAGLSRAEAAERAGMSPDYLAYLESSAAPNPTQAALTRLAAALEAPVGALSGAGLNLPPGQRDAPKNAILELLSPQQCRAHLGSGGIGRFLYVDESRGPIAIPVNYKMDGDTVVFRTGSQDGILDGVHQQHVSFDVDHLDDALAEGWSVLLSGTAVVITEPADLAHVKTLGIEPWAGGERNTYVRITPTQLTGRRIRVTG